MYQSIFILCLFVYFSVLIDFHNSLVELLKSEIETNGNNLGLGPLQDIISGLSKREVSILQIAESNLGVISINETDCRWIEQLARATLDNEDNYFLIYGSPLNFHFVYFQTYLIRTYVLYCRINYTHFEDKYHYHIQPRMPTVIERRGDIEDPTFDGSDLNEWNHLKFKGLDQLRNEFEFVQRLKTLLDTYAQDCSMMTLSEFIRLVSDDYRFTQQYEKYQIKDFRLSQIERIRGFYQQAIIRVQNAYDHVSSTIDIPMSDVVIANLDQVLVSLFLSEDNQRKKENLEENMRAITDFLEELKDVEEDIAGQSSQPFAATCGYWGFESPILAKMPEKVKCENYVPLCVKLIEIRSRLQERSIAIQESNEEKWTPYPIPPQVQIEYADSHKHDTGHTNQNKTQIEDADGGVYERPHLSSSVSTSESFDEDGSDLTDFVPPESQFKDLQASKNKQPDFVHSHTSSENFGEDENTLKDLTEFPPKFEEIEENNPNHLAQYQLKFDGVSRDEDRFKDLGEFTRDFEGIDENSPNHLAQYQPKFDGVSGDDDRFKDLGEFTRDFEGIDKNSPNHLAQYQPKFDGVSGDDDRFKDLGEFTRDFEGIDKNSPNHLAQYQPKFDGVSGDDDRFKDLGEFTRDFEGIDKNSPNHLAQYQPKFDGVSGDDDRFKDRTGSDLNSETVNVEDDKVRDLIQSQSNLEKFDGHKDQHRSLVQLTSQVENEKEDEDITQYSSSTQSESVDSDEHEEKIVKESAHHPQSHLPYRFKSKLTATSLTPAAVFIKAQDLAEKLKSSEVKKQLYVTFADGTTEKKLSGGRERLYSKLNAVFEEKRYSLDSMAIVDSLDLFVDFTKTAVDGSLPRVDVNYRVVKKTALITVKIDFEEAQYLYQATELANISSILAQLIIDNNLQFDQLENYVSVFDTFGWHVAEDCPLSKFYRLDDRSLIDIRMVRWSPKMKVCEMSRVNALDNADEVKPTIDCFHLTTRWQQIWSRLNFSTLDTNKPLGNVYFWDLKKNIIINGDEQISSLIEDAQSTDVLALKQEDVMSTVLCYDQTSVNILIPKHCSVDHLLRNQIYLEQLNLETSSPDYILVLVSADSVTRVLANNEMSQPIGSFESNGEKKMRFQISILIRIFLCGEQREKSVPIPHRNFTVQQLLETIEIDKDFKYLVSYETKVILPLNLSLSTIPDTKFFLARENQIGYLSIKRTSNDKGLSQGYLLDATIDDIYKQNKINEENRYLMLNNDFVPSRQTSLNLFLSASKIASITFTITDEKLPVNLTVINKEGDRSITFRCSHSILSSRLVEIVCNLWKLKQRFYRLKTADGIFLNPEESIAEYDESADHLQMTLETKTNIKCTISYQERNVTIPSDDDVQAPAIMEEALERLCIPLNQKNHYSLFSVNDTNDPVRFQLDDSIATLRDVLEGSPEHLLFELRLIQNANNDQ